MLTTYLCRAQGLTCPIRRFLVTEDSMHDLHFLSLFIIEIQKGEMSERVLTPIRHRSDALRQM